jgi:hypothetical protein
VEPPAVFSPAAFAADIEALRARAATLGDPETRSRRARRAALARKAGLAVLAIAPGSAGFVAGTGLLYLGMAWADTSRDESAPCRPHSRRALVLVLLGLPPGVSALSKAGGVIAALREGLLQLDPPALRQVFDTYVREPLRFGPRALQVMGGQLTAVLARRAADLGWRAAGHPGEELELEGLEPGEQLRRTIEATRDIALPEALTVLSGGLNYHTTHHLLPGLEASTLRELAPEVERICRAHGVAYRRIEPASALRSFTERMRARLQPA